MLPTISIGVARWPTSSAITPAWSSDPVTNKTTPAMERKVASAMEHQGGFTRVSNSSSSESSWSVRTLTVSLNLPSGARPPPVVIGLRLRFILCADKCSAERVKCLAPPTFLLFCGCAGNFTELYVHNVIYRESSRSAKRCTVSR